MSSWQSVLLQLSEHHYDTENFTSALTLFVN